jgi:thiamine biosynthesis lipoprotein
MGVPWTITVYAQRQVSGQAAIAAAFAEISRLEGILSDYDPDSELSRLSAASPTSAPVAVGDDLWRVLREAVAWRDASAGAFDPTIGPLTTLWRQSRRSGVMPRADKLAAARQAVGPDTLILDVDRRTAMLVAPAMRLDLGGIGMGYAIDRGMEVLVERGIGSAMIDASGDIAVSGPPPGKATWTIEVAAFSDGGDGRRPVTLELVDAAVTTSGDAFQAVEIDGVRYSHVVDPRTGLGVAGPAAVTVIAADCTTADAVATAANVLGPEAGLAFVETVPGAAAWFVMSSGGEQRETRSTRWSAQLAQPPH